MKERKVTDDERSLWYRIFHHPFSINPKIIREVRQQKERASFNTTIDLHGLSLQSAFDKTFSHIDHAKKLKITEITVITGKSGDICREFPNWLTYRPDIKKISPLNGGGAYLISF